MAKPPKAIITKQRTVHMYSELWKASRCALEAGIREPRGSSCQFLSSAVLTAFTFEAYLNHVGPTVIDNWLEFEREPPWEKFERIRAVMGVEFPEGKGKRPLQTIDNLLRFRNTMAHGRSGDIKPKSECRDVNDKLDAYLSENTLTDWQRLIQTKEFVQRARDDLHLVLKKLHAARPEPREKLFSFGLGIHRAMIARF